MTYTRRPGAIGRRYGRVHASRAGAGAMGIDFLDVLSALNPLVLITRVEADIIVEQMTKNVGAECANAGDTELAGFDARILDLRQNWNPSGFYRAEDVRDIVNSTVAVAIAADEQVAQAPRSTGDAENTIAQVRAGIKKKLEASQPYLQTASEASFKNIPVDAPALKEWVLSTMRSARQGMMAAYFFECSITWLERALMFVMRVLDMAWTAIKGVVSLAVAIGEQVAKVPDVLATVVRYAKYGLLGYGLYWVFTKVKERSG